MSGISIGENLARPLGVKSLCWRSERERSARGLLSLYELMHEVKIGESGYPLDSPDP
jgi:hypothetical protein